MTAFYSAETPPPVWFPDRNCASVCRSAARNQPPKGIVRAESLFSVDVIFRPAQHIRHGITDRSLWRWTASSAPAKREVTGAQPARRMGDGERCETYPRLAVSALTAGQRLSNPGRRYLLPYLAFTSTIAAPIPSLGHLQWYPASQRVSARIGVAAVAAAPSDPLVIYLAAYEPGGLFRSDDGGENGQAVFRTEAIHSKGTDTGLASPSATYSPRNQPKISNSGCFSASS